MEFELLSPRTAPPHVVVKGLSKPQPLESSQLQRQRKESWVLYTIRQLNDIATNPWRYLMILF